MEAMNEKIQAIKEKLDSHDKRITKHGQELDKLEERTYKLENGLDLQKEQIKLLNDLNQGIKELSKTQDIASKSTFRIETTVNNLNSELEKTKKRLEALEKQRDQDHLEKPLSWIGRVAWIVVTAIVAFILGKLGL